MQKAAILLIFRVKGFISFKEFARKVHNAISTVVNFAFPTFRSHYGREIKPVTGRHRLPHSAACVPRLPPSGERQLIPRVAQGKQAGPGGGGAHSLTTTGS